MLGGSIVLKPKPESKKAVDLGFGDLEVVDRNGRMLLTGLGRASNASLLATMRSKGSGVVSARTRSRRQLDHVARVYRL